MRLLTSTAILAMMLLLCGCPPKSNNGSSTNGGSTPAQSANIGGRIHLPLEVTVDDPAFLEMDFTEQRMYALARAVGLPLAQSDFANQKARSGLSLVIPESADGRNWTFNLPYAPGHDDDPEYLGREIEGLFTAHVNGKHSPLRAQIMDLIEGAADVSSGSLDISGIEVVGNEISFVLTRPYWQFPMWLSQPGLTHTGIAVASGEDGKVVNVTSSGFGPWRIDSFQANQDGLAVLVLKPNPDSLVGQPAAEELHFILEPDRSRQVKLFSEGKLDAAGIPAEQIAEVREDADLADSIANNDTAVMLLALFDHGQDPWGDQKLQDKIGLRKSLALCIDRETMERENNMQIHGWGHFLPEHFRSAIPMPLLNDPTFPRSAQLEEARAMQKQSDHEQGSHLPVNMDVAYLDFDNLQEYNRELIEYWRDITIKLQPFAVNRAELLRRVDLNSHEIIVFWNYPAWPSPDSLFYPQMKGSLIGNGGNYSRIDNPEINAIIEKYQATDDNSLHELYYKQLGELIEEQGLFVPVAYSTPSMLLRDGFIVNLNAYDFNASLQGQDFSAIGHSQE